MNEVYFVIKSTYFIMKAVFMIIENLFIKNPYKVKLGRWTIESCPIKISKKIELANVDHCGTCTTEKSVNKMKNIHNKYK